MLYVNLAGIILLIYLLIIAISIAFVQDIFIAVLLCGMFSLIIASIYMIMGAIDVAITEAIVGAGVSTIFFVNAIRYTGSAIKKREQSSRVSIAIIIMVTTCIALLVSINDMPIYGNVKNPANNNIYRFYIESARDRFGFADVVTAILASIRGYDTMGETTVVMLAAMSVILIIGLGDEKKDKS
ncbi:Cation:proton antiporter [Candidatus Xenohaliotis californiensis]|uniref:Cation:proton antiporter n=1 Tax=Candidatus Xenohaliotis californiensis TaxID=84677 RepID=A0ABM9N7Y1_9RICK|nr:Cation:proton antiporter [Candidatus Xenohaliotis californiensis]